MKNMKTGRVVWALEIVYERIHIRERLVIGIL